MKNASQLNPTQLIASQLIEKLNDALERTEKLQEYNYLPLVENNEGLLEGFLGFKNINHWKFIENQIIELFKDEKTYPKALHMVNIALKHLQKKTVLPLANEDPAFSKSAALLSNGSKVAVIGTFFSAVSGSYYLRGVNKTRDRLKLIDSWLTKLEEHFTPSLFSRFKKGVDDVLEMIRPKDKSEEEEKKSDGDNNNYAMTDPKM